MLFKEKIGAMECTRCGADAVMHAAYSGTYLCSAHFCESVERRVRRRIRTDGVLGAKATPEDPEKWVIGLSGGKDSIVLTTILHDTFSVDPRVELHCLSVHEGISGYRDESLAACYDLVEELDIPHTVVTYESEFGIQMDEVVESDPLNLAACSYCGVFRRDLLERYASNLEADKLFTGHNLDDEAQTALMNILEGNVEQIAKHFDASLGGFDNSHTDDGRNGRTRSEQSRFIPRVKPLRDIPEKEVGLYCHLKSLPAHINECPHSSEAYRGEIQQLLFKLEENHPGTRHSIMAGYEDISGLVASELRDPDSELETGKCRNCGAETTADVCRRCTMLEALGVP